jgi:Ras-related protein Rab-28
MAETGCTLAIIGDGSVGKSTIINAFKTDGFQQVYKQTIGCDFFERQLTIRGNQTVSLRVWDIGGQSIHSKNLSKYLGSANAVMIVYDVTNFQSFSNIEDWISKLRNYNQTEFIYLIGNKVDMIGQRIVTQKQHEDCLYSYHFKRGNFCSAKTGENIVKMFYQIAGEVIGIKLTEYELAFHDKVLKAYVKPSEGADDEVRNPWADEIEKEDMEAEKKRAAAENGCRCLIA